MLTRTILLCAALFSAPLAQALGLGGITGNGGIGERLDAYVPLYLAPGERANLTGVEILPDAFARDDDTPLGDLIATIAADGNRTHVHVTSSAPLAVERLRFRLRVITTRGAVTARYALRVPNASVVAPTPRPRSTPRTSEDAIVARPAAAVTASVLAAGEGRYGPVRNGESLWSIAKRIGTDRDVSTTMRALHALNPEAFIAGDMARLRAGVMLVLPEGASEAPAVVEDATRVRPAAVESGTSAADNAGDTNEATAARDADALLAAEGDKVAADRNTSASSTTTTPESDARDEKMTTSGTPVRDAALAARLADLDAKFAAIRAKYGDATTATANPLPAAPTEIASPSRASLASAGAPREADTLQTRAAAAPPAATASAVTPATETRPQTAPVRETSDAARWLVIAVAACAVLALLAMLPRLQRRYIRHRTQANVATVTAADADRRAEVARKAESRVRLETEIQELLQRKEAAPSNPTGIPAIAAAPVSPLERTVDPLAITQGGALLDGDREVAIDANIAHGRYAEAEALLREVIAAHPRNVQAKLRLAEVYYITEKLEGFAAIALELKERHRGDLSDEDWQRVVRMGKIIAPDLALFSGPKAVVKRA